MGKELANCTAPANVTCPRCCRSMFHENASKPYGPAVSAMWFDPTTRPWYRSRA